MHRRSFVVGMAALLAARAAVAQRVYRVATLVNGDEKSYGARVAALRAGLKRLGYEEPKNLTIIAHWNEAGVRHLPDVAAALLRERPDVVVCGPTLATAAIQKHSKTIPIVQANGAGAVKIGLAKGFARPGLNMTGLETATEELTSKHLELLKVLAPGISRVAVLNTGNYLFHAEAWEAARQAAASFKLELVDVRVGGAAELSRLSSACAKGGCHGLYTMPDPDTINWRRQIVRLAAQLKLPAMYFQPEFVQDGGLASYSANVDDMWRRAARYVDRILKGSAPGDLPIERPTKFDFLVNVRAAGELGLTIPDAVLARADEVVR